MSDTIEQTTAMRPTPDAMRPTPDDDDDMAKSIGISTGPAHNDAAAPLDGEPKPFIRRDSTRSNIGLTIAAVMAANRALNPSDDLDINDLSPPPSTISSVSSSIARGDVSDEGTPADNDGAEKASPRRVQSVQEDEEMVDADADARPRRASDPERRERPESDAVARAGFNTDDDDQHVRALNNKRKRSAANYTDVADGATELSVVGSRAGSEDARPRPRGRPPGAAVRGLIIGYWRDSPVPDPKDKHAVVAFMDVRDRLRTRIQLQTCDGRPISQEYPLPPGPGGSWVTFERIVFHDHLIGLDQLHVKEFVKLRSDPPEETEEEKRRADADALVEAKLRVRIQPPPDANMPSAQQIAYGVDIPDRPVAMVPRDQPGKRRRISTGLASNHSSSAAQTPTQGPATPLPPPVRILPSSDTHAVNMASNAVAFGTNGSSAATNGLAQSTTQPEQQQLNWDTRSNLGTRPTRILLGCWNRSSEANPANRHAVYGVLGTNDMFRVKLVRHTRDGRYVDGNFPSGPGALWIQYNEVEFDPHLRNLNRDEIKEYCRIRQRQIDQGEAEDDRIDNETKAVYEAQQRVARHAAYGSTTYHDVASPYSATHAPSDGPGVPIRPATDAPTAAATGPDAYSVPIPQVSELSNRRIDARPARHSLPGEATPRSIHQQLPPPQPSSSLQQIQPLMQPPSQQQLPTLPPLHHQPPTHFQQQIHQYHVRADGRPQVDGAPNGFDRDAIERTSDIARREVTRLGAVQNRNDQRLAHREAANSAANAAAQNVAATFTMEQMQQHQAQQQVRQQPHVQVQPTQQAQQAQQAQPFLHQSPTKGRFSESENVQALQKIWQQKEAQRLKFDAEDAKIHAGVKYERKTTGPFTGRLISQGTIINIDGEDYVEYRVLTKPSFF